MASAQLVLDSRSPSEGSIYIGRILVISWVQNRVGDLFFGHMVMMGDLYKVKVVSANNPGSAVVKSNDKLARFAS